MITNYTELQSEVSDWLKRSDLVAKVPTFIQLAEARIFRKLRTAEMQAEAVGVTSPTLRWIPVPAGCVEIQTVYVYVASEAIELRPMAPDLMAVRDVQSAYPIGYVRVGDTLRLIGGQATEYQYGVLCFISPGSLSSTNPSNWLLLKEPGLYLYGSLIETAPYLKDDPRLIVWKSMYDEIFSGMQIADDNARYGHALQMAPRGVYP